MPFFRYSLFSNSTNWDYYLSAISQPQRSVHFSHTPQKLVVLLPNAYFPEGMPLAKKYNPIRKIINGTHNYRPISCRADADSRQACWPTT